MTTLRSVLTQLKPELVCESKGSTRNTVGSWPGLEKDGISSWDDFNLEALNASYGHILEAQVPEALATYPRAADILGEASLRVATDVSHLIVWSDMLLRPTLSFAKTYARLHVGVALCYHATLVGSKSLGHVPGSPTKLRVDHIVSLDEYRPDTRSLKTVLVVGLGLPTFKFPGREVAGHPQLANEGVLRPLRQLGHLCQLSGTRYGYILTEKDFLACCFHTPEEEPVQDKEGQKKRMTVTLMPIPWTYHGEGKLTTDLALWWLCMLAMSPLQSRAWVTKADAVSIDEWDTIIVDDSRGRVRQHRYSGWQVPPLSPPPPPPPPYEELTWDPTLGMDPSLLDWSP